MPEILDHAVSAYKGFNKVCQCRYGIMVYNANDTFAGRFLDHYGEYCQAEVELFKTMVRPGDSVIDAGANIGAHTLFFARATWPGGTVLAFEPQRLPFQMLCSNIALNSVRNVHTFQWALGKEDGEIIVPNLDPTRPNLWAGMRLGEWSEGSNVPLRRLDCFERMPSLRLLKVDVEGMELAVIKGATRIISKFRPFIYVENHKRETEIIRLIASLGYSMYWFSPPYYNPQNFRNNPYDVFGNYSTTNMLCVPKEQPCPMEGLEPVEVRIDAPVSVLV